MDDHYSPVQPDCTFSFACWRGKRGTRRGSRRIPITYLLSSCPSLLHGRMLRLGSFRAACGGGHRHCISICCHYLGGVRWCLLNWWKNLSEVEKASTENISRLVLETEQIVADEKAGWVIQRLPSRGCQGPGTTRGPAVRQAGAGGQGQGGPCLIEPLQCHRSANGVLCSLQSILERGGWHGGALRGPATLYCLRFEAARGQSLTKSM